MAKSKATNGHQPAQELIPADKAFIDFDRMKPEERDMFMKAYAAGIGSAAAVAAQAEMDGINVREYMGRSPNDLRRQFTTLPRPAQGLTRRPSQRPVTNGNTGPSTE